MGAVTDAVRPEAVLLDTHTLLWALSAPERLGDAISPVLRDRRTVLLVSAASAWEIGTKHRLGRLPRADGVIATLGRAIERLGGSTLPITFDHAQLAGSLDWSHADPFDRVLAAQALVEGVPLATRDRAFSALGGLRVIW